MNILGISAYYHDSSAVLLQAGEIQRALQEERFSRLKHDPSFPTNALTEIYKRTTLEQIDYVAYYEKPLLKFERIIDSFLSTAPKGFAPFRKSIPTWAREKLFLPRTLKKELLKSYQSFTKDKNLPSLPKLNAPLVFPSHHESHAASAFFPSPFRDSAILTIDGVGEWATITYGEGQNNKLSLHQEQRFPHSLGLLYSTFTVYCGFKVNSGEYKLMGLAPYGTPKYAKKIKEHLIHLHDDGSFQLNLDYFGYINSLSMVNQKFEALFEHPKRSPESPNIDLFYMDIAASIQAVIEELLLALATHIKKITGQKNLCLAGGVALNCVANGVLARKNIFENIWIQPASGDAGGALGAALFTQHQLLETPRKHLSAASDGMTSALLGTSYSDQQILNTLETFSSEQKLPFTQPTDLNQTAAELLAQEMVIARFDGAMEFGPRALGNRSILGDARSATLQKAMNQKIKFREDFRPFAPICLEEHAAEYFSEPTCSPYMLLVSKILEKQRLINEEEAEGLEKLDQIRSTIPAVTHVDYSARLQTISKTSNLKMHSLLSSFYKLTGCPMLINTSFNVRGEPIVESPTDALRCFLSTDIDCLIIGSYLLQKSEIPENLLLPREDHLNKFSLD